MNDHPDREEFVPYLFGEAPPETKERLLRHLQGCPECSERLSQWEESLFRLEGWKLPPLRSKTRRRPLLWRWAAAALLLLGLGFQLGSYSSRASAKNDALRAEILAEVQKAIATSDSKHNQTLAQLETRIGEAQNQEYRRLLTAWIDHFNQTRTEDFRVMRATVQQSQLQNAARLVSLRKDLETVATSTDNGFRSTRQQLNLLGSMTRDPNLTEQIYE